jgi:hypothetical protein
VNHAPQLGVGGIARKFEYISQKPSHTAGDHPTFLELHIDPAISHGNQFQVAGETGDVKRAIKYGLLTYSLTLITILCYEVVYARLICV